MRTSTIARLTGLVFSGFILAPSVQATEGSGSIYPMGAESFLVGAVPPAGVYTFVYAEHYSADHLKDNDGNNVPLDFSVRANAVVPRVVWVTDNKLFGGQVLHALLVPLVDLNVNAGSQAQTKRGVGDIDITAVALAFHHSANLHSVVGFDIFAPTGAYTNTDLANVGRNYWAAQPVYAVSYVDPAGWNADTKIMLDINFKNTATDYTSGRELHADYSIGYGFADHWVAGVGGYVYKQVSADEQHGATVPNSKGQAFAIGPTVKYDSGKGLVLMLKWQKEMDVKNRPQGQAFWLKSILPF